MKKLYKIFTSRFLWTALIILVELVVLSLLVLSILSIVDAILISNNIDTFSIYNVWVIPIVTFIFEIVSIIVVIYIVNSRSSESYKISWLVLVLFIPIMGPILYLTCANKKFSKKDIKRSEKLLHALKTKGNDPKIIDKIEKENQDAIRMAQYITNSTGGLIFDDSEVKYFPLGDEAYLAMIEELRKAKHYIFIEYFIIEKGYMWNNILTILKQKALEGVDIRIIYDDVGCIGTLPPKYYKYLERFGIKASAFNPFKPIASFKVNNRDHRKILVIDGHTGFTGGINLADEYINKVNRFGHWKDNAIMIKGEGVYGLTMLFLSTWLTMIRPNEMESTNFNDYLPEKFSDELTTKIKSDGYIQPYGDVPYNYDAVSSSIYQHLIQRANKYCYITTPYLIIDDTIANALINAAKQGVDVRILTPHIPDKKIVFSITRSFYKRLIEAGVKIYEYIPGFVHMKMFVVDDIFGTVGTVNLDYRSLYLHMECGTFMYKCSCIDDMKKDFLDALSVSEEITMEKYKKISRGKKIWWAVLRLFAPLL